MLYTIPMLTKQAIQLWLLQMHRVESTEVIGTERHFWSHCQRLVYTYYTSICKTFSNESTEVPNARLCSVPQKETNAFSSGVQWNRSVA